MYAQSLLLLYGLTTVVEKPDRTPTLQMPVYGRESQKPTQPLEKTSTILIISPLTKKSYHLLIQMMKQLIPVKTALLP